ncbi:aminopeptidase P N-terminal domain-containing protein [Roseivirga pacifica]|uniref:aminopeptidase P N-terminal domain-containing protein n=1 Tax=Roseivirga pacifica TaxID=1267423 RepID=UPI002094E0CD|nr:aminopeptidase P N-terminal domain-containing protein [Roseivirga pacifica]MCO6359954.1 M24 family metallopeptidase [Roseivirga pacifica]MCO6367324.1 M24 family metallopeptidase [Roseivirga pacifica]MCO6370144.1 M24 family metallopeptidase [Roseivirga pacifica]MCO6374981.1 M24 family metallopeptidase [Roseivirga pacifica]MCO6380239.1 M24 family metallopeptidase [Roseivirga pacifica]
MHKYEAIGKDLFIRNREKLAAKLKPNSVVVVCSNDIMPTNADGTMAFRQNSNMLYLSGIDQEESILVIAPDFPDPKFREVLFVRETNEHIAVWEGHKYTKEEATEESGVQTVLWKENFEQTFNTILAETENIYLYQNEHIRNSTEVETRTDRFNKWCHATYPNYEYERLAPIIYDLRTKKEKREIEMMQVACDITEKAFRRVLKFVKPGVMEYEIEAELLHEFIRNRSKGFAYTPIIANGGNACVLHYIENADSCKDGDLILMDVGAEYGNYNADMTRTIPVNGKFNKRQREVYDAVLRVKKEATAMLTPGNRIPEFHKEVGKIMTSELIGLGLLDQTDVKNENPDWPAYKKYFMHGTSHHIGLDVHDVASIYTEFTPGMVFTVEPGIYIPDEGIGIRLEDDMLITEDGQFNLMGNIPLEAEEIESIMNS